MLPFITITLSFDGCFDVIQFTYESGAPFIDDLMDEKIFFVEWLDSLNLLLNYWTKVIITDHTSILEVKHWISHFPD